MLMRNFKALTSNPNQIELIWSSPLDFNNTTDELIITKNKSYYPVELFNPVFPDKAVDVISVEIFRGKTIVGTSTSISGSTLNDTLATFSTTPPLTGRLLRDSNSNVFRILGNTTTSLSLSGNPAAGKYVLLPDFSLVTRPQQSFEIDIRTIAGPGFIQNPIQAINGALVPATFEVDELANLIFYDGTSKFIIKSNTIDTIYFFENTTPNITTRTFILKKFNNDKTYSYIDTFKNAEEADIRIGTGLEDDTFYYYTGFTKLENVNVAQAEFAIIDAGNTTQAATISTAEKNFGDILYDYWPGVFKDLDTTEDLYDLMQVFGFQFNELNSLIKTFKLQDADRVYTNAVLPLSEQFGLASVGYSIGADTLRRIANGLISAWRLKGSKEGIALFIRIITTWDITGGVADFSEAIQDTAPNLEALRFFDEALGITNTRLVQTDPFVTGGRFVKTLPGIVIPGFFSFREFVVTIPGVALFVGTSDDFAAGSNTTTMTDSSSNFGANDSLVGNFLLPNQEEVNDIFQIVANTVDTITVSGIINNKVPGGFFAVLSPLNTNRFVILNKLMPSYIPYKTKVGWIFT